MLPSPLWARCESKYQRLAADHLFRRPFAIDSADPIISFTFDDFPHSALTTGGAILREYGSVGTYYVSLGLAGKEDASGQMFDVSDLRALREQGHELGCHTFAHCDSSRTPSSVFVESVRSNREAFQALFPEGFFRTFSFPKSAPRASTKKRVAPRFECCRGGGQTFNTGLTDLNYLRAYFIEQAKGDLALVKRIIDCNRDANGWLIFATHDVRDNPSPYGCTPEFFEAVVHYAAASGAVLLPVMQALHKLRH